MQTPSVITKRIIPQILEQHAEETAFLWILRSYAVYAPHYRLEDLAKLDSRIEAHLDGLRIAGSEAWQLCEEALKFGEPGEVFAAGILALESKYANRLERVLETVTQFPEALRGLVSAFGWVAPQRLAGTVKSYLTSDSPLLIQIGIAACAVHRADPSLVLAKTIADDQAPASLKACALRAAGQLKRRDLIEPIQDQLKADDEAVQFWAAWSSVLLGDRIRAIETLKTSACIKSPLGQRAFDLLLRAMSPIDAHRWLKNLARYPEWQRDLVVGVGIIGDPFYVPWLIKQMSIPELSRVAGEAFSSITGVDIAYEDLDDEPPQGFDAGPTENPADEDVTMDSDEDLPWPCPLKIAAWWDTNKGRFNQGVRYFSGMPISELQCKRILTEGYQRQRKSAALELALMQVEAPLFEVRAPGWRQQSWLSE
ncbi:TIGR02270 family protein [Methylotuvimicrobium buryatense]|uniref:TIGR02270 family protein n=1 Tax=Methylotuvimicrobium buryatense TaxID=95641 RepID=A0A4P9UND6_METBY|nr:TIGR02270 family protein [Methylotuvimicrobium buryatense]QCW82727.1 TIGR02270 family protein [Methylotuvimicrobium buryatense]